MRTNEITKEEVKVKTVVGYLRNTQNMTPSAYREGVVGSSKNQQSQQQKYIEVPEELCRIIEQDR